MKLLMALLPKSPSLHLETWQLDKTTAQLRLHVTSTQPLGRYDIHAIPELLAHEEISTTMIYPHVLNRGGKGVTSPSERL